MAKVEEQLRNRYKYFFKQVTITPISMKTVTFFFIRTELSSKRSLI